MSKEIGQRLRRARESLGLTLADVSRRTNIQIKYIIAIEKGDWERLPNVIYARAYIKTYAKLVGETVHFTQMSRRRPVDQSTIYSTQAHKRDLSYYTQPRQNTRRLRQIQGEVIDKTDSDQEENLASSQSQPSPDKDSPAKENEEQETVYETLPSRREKEEELRRKKVGSNDRFNRWYDRILIIAGVLLIIGFSIFFIIKSMSPPGVA